MSSLLKPSHSDVVLPESISTYYFSNYVFGLLPKDARKSEFPFEDINKVEKVAKIVKPFLRKNLVKIEIVK